VAGFICILVGAWAAIALVGLAISSARRKSDAARIAARLNARQGTDHKPSSSKSSIIRREEDGTTGRIVLRLLSNLNLSERARALLEQAGLKWNLARSVHGSLALGLAGFAIAWRTWPGTILPALAAAVLCACLPALYVFHLRSKRLRKFEEQFPESLEFLARAMRAGHAFSVSLEMIHNEFQQPLAGEFRRAFEEQNLGLPLDVALQKLAARVPLIDVAFFVSAVLLQKRTGGNLAELLDKIAHLIRERFKLRGRIRAVSAHGKMTGGVLSTIPIAVGLMMFKINPSYAEFFTRDDLGKLMLGGAVGLQLLGYAIIKRIVTIEV
jgi:tight adherence protein B